MKWRSKLSLAVAAAACGALPISVTNAQEGANIALEEIVVSARKRDESLQEVPIAVDVFTEVQLEQLSIDSVEKLARYTPSLTYDEGVLPMDKRPVIRGVNALRGRPNAGILVDFVDVSSEALTVAGGGITSNLALLDLERIEVVKGPQSALYGRSAFTGAVNYITKRPGEEFTGNVTLGYDEHEGSRTSFSFSGPLIDEKLGGMISFAKVDNPGYYRNPNSGQFLGSNESIGGSVALDWNVSERTSMFLRYERTNYEAAPRAEVLFSSIDPNFNPFTNPFGTGTMTDEAIGVPHLFPETCNGIDRTQPNADSFFVFDPVLGAMVPAGPFCRGLVVGEIHATEADIDLSVDPRTGRDFLGSDIKNSRIHFDVKIDFDDTEFMYVMGYNDSAAFVQEDFDKNSVSILSIPGVFSQYGLSAMSQQAIDTTQWSHELRLSGGSDRMTWMLSALHWTEKMDVQFDDEWWLREGGDPAGVLQIFNSPFGPFGYLNQPLFPGVNNFCDLIYPGVPGCIPAVTTIATGPGDTPYIPLQRETKHTSIAGMASFNVTDTFVVSVEARLLDEVIDYAGGGADIGFFSQFGNDPWWGWMFGPGEMTYNTIDNDAFVPKITFDWAISDSALLYAYYSQAFKPGGISTTDANGDVTSGEYKPEKLDAYEIGLKSDFRDRSIRFNASAFFYDYTDQQVPYQFLDPNTGLLQSTVINAGKTEIKGIEADLIWNSAFVEGISARLSYTHTDAEFTSFNLAEILAQAGGAPSAFNRSKAGNNDADLTGHVPQMTPENTATLSLRYDTNFNADMGGYVELMGIYSDRRFVGEDNRSWFPEYTEWDMFAGLIRNNWELTLFVENLTNDDKIKSGLSNVDYGILPDGRSVPHAIGAYLPQPRTAGIRFRYNFGN